MTYATFWQRLGAFFLDFICLLPLMALTVWLASTSRHFYVWYYLPGLLIGIWFYVYLVQRYGGTPGKLLLGVRIVKLDGTMVGYREATLRYIVLLALSAASSAAITLATLKMSDAEYLSLGWQQRALRQSELAPSWYKWVTAMSNIWIWSEFIVMLTNKKRRAPHDFMAGTVVVRTTAAQPTVQPDVPASGRSAG